jgi:selenocysteine-specific elongation factor
VAGAVAAIRERLRDSPFADAPVVPTSVTTGQGLGELRQVLSQILVDTPSPRDIGKPRLPVDRVFTLPGTGTVVTGTLSGGVVRRGQAVTLQPSGKLSRIRRIQSHSRDVEASGPGTRTALNLTDVDAVDEVHRGDVVTLGGLGEPSAILDVLLEISPRAARSIKDGIRVRVHHGSGNVAARIAIASGKELLPGQRDIAELRLEAPAFVFLGDRFAVRDWAEQHTLAGGLVLDPDAPRRALRNSGQLLGLKRLSEELESPVRVVALQIARRGAIRRSQLLLKSRFSHDDLVTAVDRLASEGTLVVVGDVIVDAGTWQSAMKKVFEVIDAAHRAHPEQRGVPLTELRDALEDALPFPDLFDPLIDKLCERELARAGSVIGRASHRAALPEPLQAAGARLNEALAQHPFDPPSRKELAPDAVSQRALRFLIETREVVEIGAELIMSAAALAQATDVIRGYIRAHGPATVSELRQALGSSRRVAVPLLEHLDRTFVTLRQGDRRALR